jgi:HEAT repeat protein
MNRIYYPLFFTIILYLQTPVLAGDLPKPDQEINENVILSLLEGLGSDNLGLKTSCAYMLGELKATDAVIPLMKILRDDKNVQARISSALALFKIGTPLSINAVKQAIKFDESQRVSNLATNFYNEYLRNKLRNNDKITDTTYVTLK